MNTVHLMSSLREKISSAARELYLRDGIEGVSMRKVARVVGLSAPALYRHYRNKEELLDEIVAAGLRILEDYLRPALEADQPYERLVRLTENFLNFALEQPEYFDFAFLTPAPKVTGFQEEIAKPDWTTFRMAVEQVAACMEQGVFQQDDPLETAITIWAEVHGLVTLFRTGRFAMDPEQFRQAYRTSVDRMLKGLMAPQTSRASSDGRVRD